MTIPEELLKSLKEAPGFDEEAFILCHTSAGPTSVRLNPFKGMGSQLFNDGLGERVPWARDGYYLKKRPSFTFDPIFHAGCYYVQEASGMFLEQALMQGLDLSSPLRILDLCAAPGGKSTLIQSMLSTESFLVSNEVIRSRAGILKDNLVKWGRSNVIVSNNDPADFSRLDGYFDAIVIDAPCSGSGLFRKDAEAIDSWSLAGVNLCSQRQQRILSDVWPALKKNGLLVYCTCSYSIEEDEAIVDWMQHTFSAEAERIKLENDWHIIEHQTGAGSWAYRFWPQRLEGEGFFLSCFRKTEGESNGLKTAKRKKEGLKKQEKQMVDDWIRQTDIHLVRHESTVYAWPSAFVKEFEQLLESLKIVYSGTMIGDLMRNKLVPAHELAMSDLVNTTISRSELNLDQAIEYLQKKNGSWGLKEKGWQLLTYKGQNLGWVNVLDNRVNNYYPKELRILASYPKQ